MSTACLLLLLPVVFESVELEAVNPERAVAVLRADALAERETRIGSVSFTESTHSTGDPNGEDVSAVQQWSLEGHYLGVRSRKRFRVDDADGDSEIVVCNDGFRYRVVKMTDWWQGVITPLGSGEVSRPGKLCVLDKYYYCYADVPVATALHTLPITAACKAGSDLVVFSPAVSNLETLFETTPNFRGFLGRQCRFRKIHGLYRIVSMQWIYADVSVTQDAAEQRSAGEFVPIAPMADIAPWVELEIKFDAFVQVSGMVIPTTFEQNEARGVRIVSTIDVSSLKDTTQDRSFEFSAPSDFGLRGVLDDCRSGQVLYFGDILGGETGALERMLRAGEDLAIQDCDHGRTPAWLLYAVATVMVSLVVLVLWTSVRRRSRWISR